MTHPPAIYWIRNDLRLADNPTLTAAMAKGPVVPVFIWAPEEAGAWAPGAATRAWLTQSLTVLGAAYVRRGSRLLIRSGETGAILQSLCAETGATAVYASRCYEPQGLRQEAAVRDKLRAAGIV